MSNMVDAPPGLPGQPAADGDGILTSLTEPQALACALRLLADEGYNENFAGHITWQPQGQTAMWCNPAGLWWPEVRASDMCLVDLDGKVLKGTRTVTEAIFIHTEIHRRRSDARVLVHGHPYHATLLSALPQMPVIAHQAGCVFDGELGLVVDYDGPVNDPAAGRHLADGVGASTGIIMANHGAMVIGDTMALATFRAVSFERMCRQTIDLMMLSRTCQEIAPKHRKWNYDWLKTKGAREYWAGAVRQLIARHPEVLF